MDSFREWTLAGIVAIIGLLLAAIKGIYLRGGKEATDNRTISDNVRRLDEIEDCVKVLKTTRLSDREADRLKIEAQFAALHGGVLLLKDQVAEFRTEVTRIYATKDETDKIERRHIDALSKELRQMNTSIIEAISDRNHAIDQIRKKIEP
jgi:hypothetical protein